MHSPVFNAEGGSYHCVPERNADPDIVDTATIFVDQLLAQAQQEVNNKKMAAGPPQPAVAQSVQPADCEEDEDITTINGLLKRGTRWQNRARQGARGIVSRLLTTLRICK